MARKFLTAVDFSKNEIQNAVVQVLASAPSTPSPGQIYYNSTSGRLEFRNASTWIDPTARANHTGTQPASTISDFNTAVQTSRLDQMAAPTASVSLNSQKITGLATPTVDSDAATKGYVDAAVNGTDWKQSVRVGTTANLGALSGLLTIDGVTLVANDRVLVKDQSTGSANGIYVAAAGAWSRSTDADVNAEVTAGLSVMITEGTTLADTQWRLVTNDPIVVGTTSLSFTQIGAGTSYSQGTGISIGGSVISIDTAVVVRKYATSIGDGSATSIAVSHGLSTLDVQVQVFENATGATVECDVTRNSTSQVTLGFAVAPTSNALRVLVQG
mgnify:CR=1 FL=1|jgi:hypothetical protein